MKAAVVVFAMLCAAFLLAYIMAFIKDKEDEEHEEPDDPHDRP